MSDTLSDAERRVILRRWRKEYDRWKRRYRAWRMERLALLDRGELSTAELMQLLATRSAQRMVPPPALPALLRGMQCGAKAKSTQKPCRQPGGFPNFRCRYHGLLSCGPKTVLGKQIASQNGHCPKRRKRS